MYRLNTRDEWYPASCCDCHAELEGDCESATQRCGECERRCLPPASRNLATDADYGSAPLPELVKRPAHLQRPDLQDTDDGWEIEEPTNPGKVAP